MTSPQVLVVVVAALLVTVDAHPRFESCSSPGDSAAPFPFPPSHLRPHRWSDRDEPLFDPAVHFVPLDLEQLRREATSLDEMYEGQKVPLPEHLRGRFAFSKPFQLLSDEGYRVARDILNREKAEGFVLPDVRIELCLRGVTYRSPFLRGLSESRALTELASNLTGEPLQIHGMISNQAHINWGVPQNPESGTLKNVDQWHIDSVSHVIIILMSQMEESEGGVLEFMMRPPSQAIEMVSAHAADPEANPIPDEALAKVVFPGPGYAVMMYGSEILHHVTPLLRNKNNEPRITMVQSFQSQDPFKQDRTRWQTFSEGVSSEWAAYEWLHYHSWRLSKQLAALPQTVAWEEDPAKLSVHLRRIASELVLAADQMERKTVEEKVWVDENAARQKRKEEACDESESCREPYPTM